ncbi:WD40 repeat domain-containing protein [Streptomyces sp. NPDC049954]|uniref:WD40 repeat domain-containing protein n=1 Tax=Streptomyces sp. NPDC049954 TaxID=3155779 RepID=UPI00343E3C8E
MRPRTFRRRVDRRPADRPRTRASRAPRATRGPALLAALLLSLAGALTGVLGGPATPARADDGGHEAFTIEDPRVTESSGLAASTLHPGVYWTHNDSDDGPYVYAVDSRTGRTVARVTLTGIGSPRDVEAISIGPGHQIYLGDIGDNLGGKWPHVWIYRFPEPKELRDQTLRATQFTVQYADGPRNAEALMVHPGTGRVYIASKKEEGGALYEGPRTLTAHGTNVFRELAPVDLWVTDGAFSPDGRQLSLRGYFGGQSYAWNDGRPKAEGRLSVPLQRQGESMTYTPDGTTLMYGSEGEHSRVQPEPVKDAHGNPSTAPGEKGGANPPGDKNDQGDRGGKGGGRAQDGDGAGFDADFSKVAVVFVIALGVVLVGRRLLGGRGGGNGKGGR